jgi:hypothetical protein
MMEWKQGRVLKAIEGNYGGIGFMQWQHSELILGDWLSEPSVQHKILVPICTSSGW